MQIIVRRMAMAVVLWLLLCAMVMTAALPAAGQEMEKGVDVHIFSAKSEKKDGILAVTVEFATYHTYRPGDMLWITISCGGQSRAIPLKEVTGESLYSVTLSGCLEPDRVCLEIRGFRRGEDDSLHPVRCVETAPVEGDRILKLDIKEGETWDLYLVGELWELLNGYLVLNEIPTREELEIYGITGNLITTWLGLEDGHISWNLTESGCPDGVYLLREQGSGEAFYVTVPRVDAHGDVLAYMVDTTE